MIDKTMQVLLLVTAMMGLLRTKVLGVEALPPRALARLGDHRFYHGPGITCAVLSPDGRRIASAASYPTSYLISDKERDAYDSIIVLWAAAAGERLRQLRTPHRSISALAFSPDGKRLAAACEPCVVVFEVETGKLLRQFGKFNSVSGLSFSADGKQLRVSEGGHRPLSAWDAATGKQLRLWKPPALRKVSIQANAITSLPAMEGAWGADLSPDGKFIAWHLAQEPIEDFKPVLGNPRHPIPTVLIVRDALTDKPLYRHVFDADCPVPFAFSHDGRRFLRFEYFGKRVAVWETSTGKELLILAAPSPWSFALSPDGRYAALAENNPRVGVWEFWIYWRLTSKTNTPRVGVWDLDTGIPRQELYPVFADIRSATQAFSDDSKSLLLAGDSTLRLFDVATGKERALSGHHAAVAPRFSADGRTLFTTCAERRCRWDVSKKEPALLGREARKSWEDLFGQPVLAFSADERFLLDRLDRSVRVRETATGRVLRPLEGDSSDLFFGQFAPDATRILLPHYPNEGIVMFRLYDAATGKQTGEIKPVSKVGLPVFSPDGRLIAWMDQTAIHLHDAATGKIVQTLHSSPSFSKAELIDADLHFSPDGARLMVMAYRCEPSKPGWTALPLRVFQLSSGREILRFYANPEKTKRAGRLSCLACSPDGRLLAVAEKYSDIVRLLEIASGKVRVEFVGHLHGVHGLAFAPDGKTLASGGEDNVVFLWDVTGAKMPIADNKASDNDLSALWNDLSSEDGKRAGIAIASLLRKPEASAAFLQEKLHPVEKLDGKRLAQWIADLDSDAFEKRESASRELIRLGECAEAALRRELMNRPSLEMRRRIEDVLSNLEPSPPPPETLRTLRAIEVLEHIGTPAARRCLEALAKGAADARPTREAQAALRRLTKR